MVSKKSHRAERSYQQQNKWLLYSRVPSKRVAIVSRKVFWGARRPFITGILTQMWNGLRLAGGYTISGAQQVASGGFQQVQAETMGVTVRSLLQERTFTATLPRATQHQNSSSQHLQPGSGAGSLENVKIWSSGHLQLLGQ